MNQNKFIHAQNAQGETVPVLDFSIKNWNLQNMGFKSEFEGCWWQILSNTGSFVKRYNVEIWQNVALVMVGL